MPDTLTVLRHNSRKMAKTWTADGAILPYDDAKYFTLKHIAVDGHDALSATLRALERSPGACIIRGRYVGDARAAAADPEHKPGLVRRTLAAFEDQPLHTLLVEIDEYEPVTADPVLDPVASIDEFIALHLPSAFQGARCHWQLSGSAGSPAHRDKLKAHLWFWLERPYTSAQLRAWARHAGLPIDTSVLNPVQVHYTAAPLFETGVADPVPVRSGVLADTGDAAVRLDIPDDVLASATPGGNVTRQQKLQAAGNNDPIAAILHERGLVKTRGRAGELFIECPRAELHTSDGGPTSTVYYPPHTGGFDRGAFKCLHAHCQDASRGDFLAALGYDDITADFEVLEGGGEARIGDAETESSGAQRSARKGVPEAEHLTTDQANANRIARRFGTRMLVAAGRWHVWSGKRWVADEGEVYRYACRLSAIIEKEAATWDAKALAAARVSMGAEITLDWLVGMASDRKLAKELPDDSLRALQVAAALRKWAAKSEMKATIDAAVGLAKRLLSVDEALLDQDPWALNCANGTVDLRTGALRPHDPGDLITKLVGLDYDPSATAPLFVAVLAQVTMEEGRKTQPLAEFLQRWFGYCATGSTREQKFVVHHGSGRNGKSTVLDSVAEVLGDYAGTAAPGILVSSGKDRHPTEIADLFGRRMVTAHETGEGGALREDFVKQATGSDRLKARFMRADFFEFNPTHKLQLLTNHKPVIKGQDEGIWRRVLLFPYTARFGSPEEVAAGQATHLRDTRVAEHLAREWQGILSWIVRGAVAWFSDGLNPPDAVLAASKDYQTEQDRILQFVRECCEVGVEYETPLTGEFGGLYSAYGQWCREGGIRGLSKIRFTQELERVIPYYRKESKKIASSGGGRRKVVIICGIRVSDGVAEL